MLPSVVSQSSQRVQEERVQEVKGRGNLRWIIDGSSARLNGKGSMAVRPCDARLSACLVATLSLLLHDVAASCAAAAGLLVIAVVVVVLILYVLHIPEHPGKIGHQPLTAPDSHVGVPTPATSYLLSALARLFPPCVPVISGLHLRDFYRRLPASADVGRQKHSRRQLGGVGS